MIGEIISHYKIVEKLGWGGMGVVYKAQDLELDRFVALKFLPAEFSIDEEAKERFIHEAKSASSLQHHNICTIHEINTTHEDQLFICMDFYEGETLREKIKSELLNVYDSIDLSTKILEGLSAAHEKGITHRDVKPENIFITNKNEVKILDFGLAKSSAYSKITKSDRTSGTIAYISPEQARGKEATQQSDIWSLGVVMYEMLTGQKPFKGDFDQVLIYSILDKEPEKIASLKKETPLELEHIVSKALEKDVDSRYQNVDEMKADLQALREGKGISSSESKSKKKLKQYNPLYILVATVVLISIIEMMWFFIGQTNDREYTPPQIKTLTSLIGTEAHPTFSPDGNKVAFTWNGKGEDNYDIYVKLIGTESISRLTTDPKADFRASWSPDGSKIAFMRQGFEEKTSIYIMPSIGGQGRKVTEIYSPKQGYHSRYNKIAWHPNGEWLVLSDKNSAEEPLSLFLLSLETGEKTRLTSPDSISSADGDHCASFSKDGNSIVFSRHTSWLKTDLFVFDLSSDLKPVNKPRRIISPEHYIDGTGFTNDDKEIIYSSDNLWRISRTDPSNPKQVMSGNKIADIAISPHGNRLVYRQDQKEVNIWRMSLTGTSITDNPAERLISSTGIDGEPVYSPDGQKIAFLSNRSGKPEIWICDSDGSNPFQLTSMEKLFTNGPSWSPDGKFIVFDTIIESKQDIYIVNVEGGNPRRLTTDPDVDWLSAWSKDGEWIYFTSHRTGKNQVWKIKLDGSDRKQLTKSGGLAPLESPDGKYIYYAKDRSYPASLWKVSVNGEQEQKVVEQFKGWRKFWPVEKGIYFVLYRDIKFLNFDTGKTKTVTKLPRTEDYGIAVSPDRSYLLYGLMDRKGSDLFLVENFK